MVTAPLVTHRERGTSSVGVPRPSEREAKTPIAIVRAKMFFVNKKRPARGAAPVTTDKMGDLDCLDVEKFLRVMIAQNIGRLPLPTGIGRSDLVEVSFHRLSRAAFVGAFLACVESNPANLQSPPASGRRPSGRRSLVLM